MAGQLIRRESAKGEVTWLVRVFLNRDSQTGKRKYHNHTVHGNKKDAQRYLNGVLREIDLGVFVEPSAMSLSEYVDKWLKVAARPRVSPRTADGYEALLRRYILEPLGIKRLDSLKALDIQRVYGDMQMRGLSARIIRHTQSALHNALKQAVKWGMLSRNPSEYVELPKVPHKERRVLSPNEAMRFLKTANEMPYGLMFEFALITGMRPEEYLALKWSDVDFERGTVTVQRALVRHKKNWSFRDTKTSRSRRKVPLPAQLLQKLGKHKRNQFEARMKIAPVWQANDLIFCSETGTPLIIPNLTYRYFRPILEKAELPQIRLYDLRHSCATLLLMADENPKVVSERLGHSTIVLTLDTYSHVLPTMQQQATVKLEKMLYSEAGTQKEAGTQEAHRG
ncbi:MAG: site-specific integrase [Acidobacteria bacterium]|nr:site-specific integrase [Acidobacteriota bacterium]